MANYKLVDVSAIQSNEPRSHFPEVELEELADLLLTTGILAMPLIIKEVALHSYQVLHGHKAYYAAARAKEKNPRKAEMVNAFVIDSKDSPAVEESVLKQVKNLPEPISRTSDAVTAPSVIEDSSTQVRLGNLETRINQHQQNQQKLEKDIERKLEELKSLIPPKRSFLDEVNTLEPQKLVLRLKGLGVPSAETVCEIIIKERKVGTFNSFLEIVDRVKDSKGKRKIGERKMLEILQIAAQTIFLE